MDDDMDDEDKKKINKSINTANNIINSNKDNEIPQARIDNTSWHELVYNPLALLQLSMPHKDPHNAVEWQVRNGEADLLLRAGKIKNKDGHFESAGLPFGSFARLMLLWIYYTVQHDKRNSLFVWHSKAEILRKFGESTQGASYDNLHEQMPRLFHCDLVINKRFPDIDIGDENRFPFQGSANVTEYQRFASTIAEFENKSKSKDPENDKRGYHLEISEGFYNSIMNNPLPIDFEHVKQLKNHGASYKLDIYVFLADRLHKIPADKPLLIDRNDIEDLFGAGVKNDDKERKKFYRDTFLKKLLPAVMEVYTGANVEIIKKRGIVLHRSPPPIQLEKPESSPQLPPPD